MADKDTARLSKEEIARQFMLPERKSKIATLLKQDGQSYCICRSSDSSRFMIGCDNCEEWYHGDCISISEKEAKYITQYFCMRCQEEDPTLQTKFKTPKKKRDSGPEISSQVDKKRKKKEKTTEDSDEDDFTHQTKVKQKEERRGRKRKDASNRHTNKNMCGKCSGCTRTEDCGICANCKRHGSSKCLQRECFAPIRGSSGHRKRRDSSSDDGLIYNLSGAPIQCYGPRCVNAARPGSKYCSDECGMKLAASRIYQILPQRIQEWSLSPCLAEESNRRALEAVRKQQVEVKKILQELDRRYKEIDAVVKYAKTLKPIVRSEDDVDEENETSMYCITCGHEIHTRTAVKHLEKCFNKYESQSSFGSVYKTRVEGNNMFCDYYNHSNRTYCKRLRVLCPEHSKAPKVSDSEVCGCPLVRNVFNLTGELCRVPKKSCLKHYCWEKLRRAEVDMEKVRQWLKIDELIEQERQLRHTISNRAGVLALMLHSTYNHELLDQANMKGNYSVYHGDEDREDP